MNKILLQCDNLCKRYQEGSVQTDVLHNVSFSVGEGEMINKAQLLVAQFCFAAEDSLLIG